LFSVPVKKGGTALWTPVLAHRDDVMLEGMDFFKNHHVLYEREQGLPQLRITDLRTGKWHRVEMPEPVYAASAGQNQEWDTRTLRFNYQSLITPRSVYDYQVDSRKRTLLKQ